MKSYALFQEYIWLVNTIHKAGKITLEEIKGNEKALEYANELYTKKGYTWMQAATETYMLFVYSSKEARR